jgi:thiol-disulfide isomerase/thioredoxin
MILRLLLIGFVCCAGCRPAAHPAIGLPVGSLQLVPLANPEGQPPKFAGKVTVLNFWGTWCPPCRRELPGLARLAERLANEPAFQLVAVSCGAGGPDDPEKHAAITAEFLAEERLLIDMWGDPDGFVRMLFAERFGFTAFPTTYLIGADGRIRNVWVGYRRSDEAEMAREVLAALKESAAIPASR